MYHFQYLQSHIPVKAVQVPSLWQAVVSTLEKGGEDGLG